MSYRIEFEEQVEAQLAALPPREQERVMARLAALGKNARPHPQSRALTGALRGLRRLRVGDLRVAYAIEESERVVWIVRIGLRDGFYEKLGRQKR